MSNAVHEDANTCDINSKETVRHHHCLFSVHELLNGRMINSIGNIPPSVKFSIHNTAVNFADGRLVLRRTITINARMLVISIADVKAANTPFRMYIDVSTSANKFDVALSIAALSDTSNLSTDVSFRFMSSCIDLYISPAHTMCSCWIVSLNAEYISEPVRLCLGLS